MDRFCPRQHHNLRPEAIKGMARCVDLSSRNIILNPRRTPDAARRRIQFSSIVGTHLRHRCEARSFEGGVLNGLGGSPRRALARWTPERLSSITTADCSASSRRTGTWARRMWLRPRRDWRGWALITPHRRAVWSTRGQAGANEQIKTMAPRYYLFNGTI